MQKKNQMLPREPLSRIVHDWRLIPDDVFSTYCSFTETVNILFARVFNGQTKLLTRKRDLLVELLSRLFTYHGSSNNKS